MRRKFTFFTLFMVIVTMMAYEVTGQVQQRAESTVPVVMPYLKECKSAATDTERYQCTLDKLIKIIAENFECPWRDLDGEYSRIILRFTVNSTGNLEKFLTLYSDNVANRPTDNFNSAMIRAVNVSSGDWVPVKEGGRSMPREVVLPVECNCTNQKQPIVKLIDTIPAYFADGHYQLESFIEQHIVYPDGFLSKSGRQTAVLLKAEINSEGDLDTTSIRVINLNSIDYRLSENAINILLKLAKKAWEPAMVRGEGPINYEIFFKAIYVDDKNPRKGSTPMEWDITVGNNHLFNSGAMEFTDKNYAAAVELFERAVFLDPDDKESWLMLGQSYIGTGKNTKARTALQRSIKLGCTEAEKWLEEADKPDREEPPKLPEKEIKKRPEQVHKVKPATYGSQHSITPPPTGQKQPVKP